MDFSKNEFSGKKGSVSLEIFQWSTMVVKIKKLMTHSWEKCQIDGQKDWQTDNGGFIRASIG